MCPRSLSLAFWSDREKTVRRPPAPLVRRGLTMLTNQMEDINMDFNKRCFGITNAEMTTFIHIDGVLMKTNQAR